jgi:HlyD family secretion protein
MNVSLKGIARRRSTWMVAAGAALIGIAAFWWLHRAPPVSYQTAPATRGSITRTVTASGTVNPVTTIQVGTYVSGVIQKLYCDFNSRVTAGQLCAKIDPRPYQSIVDQEKAALGTARAQLEKDRANLAFTKLISDRDADLLRRQIVSQETVDTARNALEQARSQIAFDESSVAQHLALLNSAKVNLDYTNIISPVDGTVVSRNVTQGQTVAASFQTPTLFLIATDLTQMQVDTNVSESDIGNVVVGDKVIFTVEAYPERNFSGSVVQVRQAPQSVQNVITYDVVAGVPNADLSLKPGMTAAVRIVTAERVGVLRVPDQALRYSPGGPTGRKPADQSVIWKLQDDRPVQVPVKLGLDDGSYAEVLEGRVAAGDNVIVGESSAAAGPKTLRMPRL